MMKILLLRVGIDTGTGRSLGPIFEDGSFEYVPIPEGQPTTEKRTFAHLRGRSRAMLKEFVHPRYRDSPIHEDPEFRTFTYGDTIPRKVAQMRRLVPDDLLVFYAGLKPVDGFDKSRVFIIGYFKVKKVYDLSGRRKSTRMSVPRAVRSNAHIKRKKPDKTLVVVKGYREESTLLSKASPLGNGKRCPLPDLVPTIDYERSLRFAVGHWIDDEEHVRKTRMWLRRGVASLIDDDTTLYSYVLAHDKGFAPHVADGLCSLACCKPITRKKAEIGDWVMGTLPKRLGENRIGYVMRVSEMLSFDQYFRDRRFRNRRPSADNPDGDNIYYKARSRFKWVKNRNHDSEDNMRHDTQVDRVLIGSLFWYFGERSPEIPRKLVESIVKRGPNHRGIANTETIRTLVRWLSSNHRIGVLGYPRDRKEDCAGPNSECP
jgi:hypothetical protein